MPKSFYRVIALFVFHSLSPSLHQYTQTQYNLYFSFIQSILFSVSSIVFYFCSHTYTHWLSLHPHRPWVNTRVPTSLRQSIFFQRISSVFNHPQNSLVSVWKKSNRQACRVTTAKLLFDNELPWSKKMRPSQNVTVAFTLTWPRIGWLEVANAIKTQFHFT